MDTKPAVAICAIITLSGLAGCGILPGDRAQRIEVVQDRVAAIAYTASLRGAYVVVDGTRTTYCTEPPPDVALSVARELEAALEASIEGQGSGSASISENVNSAAMQLAGRSEVVVLSRELLFRLCELSANHDPAKPGFDKLVPIYSQIAGAAVDLAQAERDNATSRLLEAQLAAGRTEQAQQTKIDAILSHVGKSDGSIDRARLETLITRSPSAGGVREALLAQGTRDALARTLDDFVADLVIDEMHAALR